MAAAMRHSFYKAPAFMPGLCALLALLALPACEEKEQSSTPLPPAPTGQPAQQAPALADTPHFSAENAYAHCAALCALGPRPSGSAAYAAQLKYLEKHLKAAGWQLRQESFAPMPGMRMVNLHAQFTPTATASEPAAPDSPAPEAAPAPTEVRPLLISCHIDTKAGIPGFIGADDGASAAGVMLEAARILATQHPEWAAQVEFVFFDGEEAFGRRMNERDGMYGSKHDVARRKGNLPRWQLNLDMVGGRDMMIAIPLLDTSDTMVEHYERAISALGLAPERWTAYPGSYLDDHLPFVEAGVDSLNLIAYFQSGGWWHTTRDNMERISPRSLEESGRMLLQLCRQLLGGE